MSRPAVEEAITDDWQSKQEIAEAAGLSGYGVKKFLGPLLEKGHIEKRTAPDGRVLYRSKV